MNPDLFAIQQQRWETRWRDYNRIAPDEVYEFDHDHFQEQVDVYVVFREQDGDPDSPHKALECPVCGVTIGANVGTGWDGMRVLVAQKDEPDDDDYEEISRLSREDDRYKAGELGKKYPHIRDWLRVNAPREHEDVYGLSEVVYYNPAVDYNPDRNTGIYRTRWYDHGQYIWQNEIHVEDESLRELILTSDAERDALKFLASGYRHLFDWDEVVQDAFDHAMDKDD